MFSVFVGGAVALALAVGFIGFGGTIRTRPDIQWSLLATFFVIFSYTKNPPLECLVVIFCS